MADRDPVPTPHSLPAERALLGCMMQSPDAIDAVRGVIEPAHFYRPDHGRLFGLLVAMRDDDVPVDLVTVSDRVMRGNRSEEYGGLAYVMTLPDAAPSTVNAATYAGIVRSTYLRRSMVRTLDEAREALLLGADEADEVLTRTRGAIDAAMGAAPGRLAMTEAEAWEAAGEQIAADERERTSGGAFQWGLGIDAILNPPSRGQLIVIGARPAMGKTALGLHVHRQAIRAGAGALFVSLEVESSNLIRRHAAEVGVDYTALTRGVLGPAGWEDFAKAQRRTFNRPGFYMRKGAATVAQIAAAVREVHRACPRTYDVPLRVVVVDYVGLVQHHRERGASEADAIGHTSRTLKLLAVDLGVAVVAMSQLNREVEKRSDKRPTLADLRSSGSLEQDADAVLLLWSNEAPGGPAADRSSRTLTIAKQRTGGLGDVALEFIGKRQSFDRPVTGNEWEVT